MADNWILDVLADLKAFATQNGLSSSERQLDRTMIVVSNEIASVQGIARESARRGIVHAGTIHRPTGESANS